MDSWSKPRYQCRTEQYYRRQRAGQLAGTAFTPRALEAEKALDL